MTAERYPSGSEACRNLSGRQKARISAGLEGLEGFAQCCDMGADAQAGATQNTV